MSAGFSRCGGGSAVWVEAMFPAGLGLVRACGGARLAVVLLLFSVAVASLVGGVMWFISGNEVYQRSPATASD